MTISNVNFTLGNDGELLSISMYGSQNTILTDIIRSSVTEENLGIAGQDMVVLMQFFTLSHRKLGIHHLQTLSVTNLAALNK
jgi:hypothetical protein